MEVEKLAAERVAKARAELILARTFYGVLVSQVEPIASTKYPTMATDGRRHFYNPAFINSLTPAEALGVQAHESEHDARRHHTRRGARDPKKWNVACDYAINIDLIDEGFTLPKDALIDPQYRGMSAEDIYRTRELDEAKQQQQQQPQPGDDDDSEADQQDGDDQQPQDGEQDGDEEQDGSEADDDADQDDDDDGSEADDEAGDDDADEDGDGTGGDAGDEADDAQDGQGEAGSEPGTDDSQPGENGTSGDAGEADGTGTGEGGTGEAEAEATGSQPSSGDPGGCGEVLDAADDAAETANEDAKWETVLRQAAMLAAKRGDAPGHVAREIERSDHPPQDWRETLRAFFDGGATSHETWSRPNRRFIGSGLYLPGRERDGVNRAAFLIDTSGSMDDIALAAIEVETQAALDENVIDEVVVIYGDTRVTRVDTYRSGDEIEFDPKGGGGTVLRPLFDHVAAEVVDASMIVCFTDGFIDITSDSPEPACPVLWAFTGYPTTVRRLIQDAPWGAPGIDVGAH